VNASVNDFVNDENAAVNGGVNTADKMERLTKWLLGVLVAIPFLISFAGLKELATDMGVNWPSLYPLMLDGGVVIFKVLAATAALRGERNNFAWGMAFALTGVSIGLNIAHIGFSEVDKVTENFGLAAFMHGLPPLMVFLAFFAVITRIESQAKGERAALTYEGLLGKIESARATLADLGAQVTQWTAALATAKEAHDTAVTILKEEQGAAVATFKKAKEAIDQRTAELTAAKEALEQEVATLRGEAADLTAQIASKRLSLTTAKQKPDKAATGDDKIAALLEAMRGNPDASYQDLGTAVGASKGWVSNRVGELKEAGHVHRNGHGWEVLTK